MSRKKAWATKTTNQPETNQLAKIVKVDIFMHRHVHEGTGNKFK